MNVKRMIFLAVPAGVVVIYYLMLGLTFDESGRRDAMTGIEQEIKIRAYPGLYDVIEAGFPQDYADHIDALEEITVREGTTALELGPDVIKESETFLADLRNQNLQHVKSAGRDRLLEVQRARLAVLTSVDQDAELCREIVQTGLHRLPPKTIARIDPGTYGAWVLAQVKAMIAGRDTPDTFDAPSEDDWRVFLKGWFDAAGGNSPEMTAFLQRDTADAALFCEANIAFTRRLIADSTPSGLRILADFSGAVSR